jgi:signal transduction histidine kinase
MEWLLGGTDFMPRAACGQWESWVLAEYVIANLLITAAYLAIPAGLALVSRRGGTTIPDRALVKLFVMFILLCGVGHTVETVIVWHPWYRFATFWHTATAVVSVLTVIVLARRLPMLLQLRSPIELEAANRRLDEANQDLEQFAYSASHDLQEPLRVLASFSDLLLSEKAELLDDDSRQWLDQIQLSATRMSRMVDDLLVFARTGRSDELHDQVSLDEVFAEAVELLAAPIEESNADIEVEPLFAVRGNRGLLLLAAKNLLSNAIKYSPRDARIRVFARSHSVCVRDNGIGIAGEYHEKIFDVFRRLHRDEYAGTGVGLALVRRIAQFHDAEVSVDSTPGDGATFAIRFPD